MQIKIEGTKYSRDIDNRALVCNDRAVLDNYMMERRKERENQRRDTEINSLKKEISEIKSMLQTLISRGQNG